ncbi:hypothetical protein P0082_05315 [Candidatus Haliotispira prima]|uniref:Uncharacterized protein n=1 Tax=Candidatus Haliotispira prima TaxID=3034016 RepID=A0ABY8MJS5_9SPIO|nr:hypothetical protein P0082_05315 [Candidatus Haliotispira prima]
MASSLQLEISSNVELANIGAVVRLATKAAPTKAEAQASAGHVSVGIPAGVTRKISISQHYGSIFSDGVTLADVLAPKTAYKLYLYFPAEIITTTAEITGLSITDDKAVVPFTTAALPAEGDAKWLSNIGSKCVGSLDSLYFMQKQTGVVVCYFYANFDPLAVEIVSHSKSSTGMNQIDNVGTYTGAPGGGVGIPGPDFYFAYGSISGYTSNSTTHYAYWLGADKTNTLQNPVQSTVTDGLGLPTTFDIPGTRH